ncbi:MAG TPA: hypothetical protein VK705_07545 [Ferruginibacter sp.]|jgi:hypothetical protein|nr:hypothetical protein [Ferruginibacter sp.]
MKKIYFIISLAILIFSCNNTTTAPAQATPNNTDTTQEEKPTTFFPVTSFLKSQLIALDSVPFTPLVYTIVNDKTDSLWLKKEQLKTFLAPFFSVDIDTTNLIKYFKETKFNDQTLNAITLMYEPLGQLPDTLQLRSWNVYIDPTSGNVRSIYIEKEFKENGESYIQQLIWTTDKSAKIITILNQPNGNTKLLKEQKIIWDDNQ